MYSEYEPYEELANAIVQQAVDDYKKELHKLEKNPKNKKALLEASRLERFFHSGWYSMLTSLNPDQLLAGVRILVKKEAVEEQARIIKRRVNKCLKEMGEILSKLDEPEKPDEPGDATEPEQTENVTDLKQTEPEDAEEAGQTQLSREDQYRFKALAFEALNRTASIAPIKEEAESIGADAIRRVGFQVRE